MAKVRAVWRDRLFVGPAYMCEPGSLRDARKAISARIREDRWKGSKFAALWADKPIRTMQAGMSVNVFIGKHGFHLWATYYVESV